MPEPASSRPGGSKPENVRLRLRITAAAETAVRNGHPWVFASSIRDQNRAGRIGELAILYDRKDTFLALGLFDPDSPLRVRILHTGKPRELDAAWWEERLAASLEARRALFGPDTTGYRLIHGESDGWPGLVLDRYETTLVLKVYTAAWFPRIAQIVELLVRKLSPERLVLRLSRNIQVVARTFSFADGQVLHGPVPAGPIVFRESGLRFESEVLRGQKTGFFLDQRENRRLVGHFAAGARVLNAFSFSGGFSVYAAQGGARAVTDLDISPHALSSAERNFRLNVETPGVSDCLRESVQADTFSWLEQSDAVFDLIILDPPALAKKAAERSRALAAYDRLVRLAIRRLSPGGLLVSCSCSAQVTKEDFFSTVIAAAGASGRVLREERRSLHPPDHPALFPEAEYLKAIYLRDLAGGKR